MSFFLPVYKGLARIPLLAWLSVLGLSQSANAQTDPFRLGLRAGIGTASGYGLEVDVPLKKKALLTLGVSYRTDQHFLGFGEDTTGLITFPVEQIVYDNEQKDLRFSLGLRLVDQLSASKWYFIYAVRLGVLLQSKQSEAYRMGLARPDRFTGFFTSPGYEPADQLELGGRVGMRYQLLPRVYAEAAIEGLGTRRLTDDSAEISRSANFPVFDSNYILQIGVLL